jgi:hypothetical protein
LTIHTTHDPYAAADHPAPIDPEAEGLIWRICTNLSTLTERLEAAREAAAYGPGQAENHVITHNRLSHPPAALHPDGSIADPELTALRKLRDRAAARLRTTADWLDRELTGPITDGADPGDPTDEDVRDDRIASRAGHDNVTPLSPYRRHHRSNLQVNG